MLGTAIYNTNLYNTIDITLCVFIFLISIFENYMQDRMIDTPSSKVFFWFYIFAMIDEFLLMANACSCFFLSPEHWLSGITTRLYMAEDLICFATYFIFMAFRFLTGFFNSPKRRKIFTYSTIATCSILYIVSFFLPVTRYNVGINKIIYTAGDIGMMVCLYPIIVAIGILLIYIGLSKFKKLTKEEKISYILTVVTLAIGLVIQAFMENETLLTSALTGFIVLLTYLTIERKSIKLISNLEEDQQALNESNEIQEKFFGVISHDMRNPLNVIIGNSEYILNTDLSKEKFKTTVEDISTSAYDLKNFMGDIINVSKVTTEKLTVENEKYSVIEMIQNITGRLSGTIESQKIKCKVDVNPEMKYMFNGDESKIHSALLMISKNIINNKGDNINIKFDSKTDENNITNLIININHTGSFFSKEDFNIEINDYINLLSENSETLKNDFLGILVAREYIKLLNGTISYETNINTWIDIKIPQEVVSDERICDTELYKKAMSKGDE